MWHIMRLRYIINLGHVATRNKIVIKFKSYELTKNAALLHSVVYLKDNLFAI